MATAATATPEYPARLTIEPHYEGRNRLTTFFRIILAIPHLILVGGGPIAFGAGGGSFTWGDNSWGFEFGSNAGLIGLVAIVCAIISWFAILFTRNHPRGLWDLGRFYLRWRARAVAYTALLRDNYPPFGDTDYPVDFEIDGPPGDRDRLSVGLRIIFAIPHLIVLAVLSLAWVIVTVIAWFAILFTGNYPRGLYDFSVGVFRWDMRVWAYMLLLRDEYPPFSLD